jgi:hypothetical protein
MIAWLGTTDHPRGCNTPAVARQFVYTASMIARSSLLTVCLLALPPLFATSAGAFAATPANAGRANRLLAVSDSAYVALDLARAYAAAAAAVAQDSTRAPPRGACPASSWSSPTTRPTTGRGAG